MSNCCPKASFIGTVEDGVCTVNYREIHRIVVLRKGNVIWDLPTKANNLPASIVAFDANDIGGWDVLKALATEDKAVWFPKFGSEIKITPGGELSSVGLANAKQHIGFDPSEFVAFYEGLTAIQEGDISDYICELDDLECYFILHDKRIVGSIDDVDTPVLWTGIPLASAMVLMGRSVNGFLENDKNELSFQLLKNWSLNAYAIVPTFNTLTY